MSAQPIRKGRDTERLSRLPVAVVVASAVHMAGVLLLISPAAFHSDGLETGQGVEVTLINGESWPSPGAEQAPASSPFEEMMDSEPVDSAVEALSPSEHQSPPRSLAEALGAEPKSQPAASRPKGPDSDLWRAIEPCWNRVAGPETTSVTLQVSFSPLGNLAKPPVILREPGTSPDPKGLRSESLAIAALSQCGPYPMVSGKPEVVVMFP